VAHGDLLPYEKLLRFIRERKRAVEDTLLYGGIGDFTVFREQRAKLSELSSLEQELKSLLDKVEND
jgi:hypothetical protein